MNTRPILNEITGVTPAATADAERVPSAGERLASHLPAWDLVPSHTLLVRRRSGLASKTTDTSEAPLTTHTPVLASQPHTAQHAQVPSVEPSAPVLCRQCKQPLEEGASFCSECGAKQD